MEKNIKAYISIALGILFCGSVLVGYIPIPVVHDSLNLSIMLCVPVCNRQKVSYLAVPLGYRIWRKKSKLELMEETFFQYKGESVQEFLFALSGQIRQQVFYANLVQNIETHIKSMSLSKS